MLTVVEAVATAMGLMVNSVVDSSVGVVVDCVVMIPVPTMVSHMVMLEWGGLRSDVVGWLDVVRSMSVEVVSIIVVIIIIVVTDNWLIMVDSVWIRPVESTSVPCVV